MWSIVWGIRNEQKNSVLSFHKAYARKNMRVREFFAKMLTMAWNICKMNFRQFGSFFVVARAITRGRTRTHALIMFKSYCFIVSIIVSNMKLLWYLVIEILVVCQNHKMAPRWRHIMLMNFKQLLAPDRIKIHHCAKFEHCPSHFREILDTNLYRRNKK